MRVPFLAISPSLMRGQSQSLGHFSRDQPPDHDFITMSQEDHPQLRDNLDKPDNPNPSR
jgi:hypothetical protein